MSLRTGMYKVEFRTPLGNGAGVVVIEDGKVRGGDSAMMYVGTYTESREEMTANIRVARHTNGMQSVFGTDNVVAAFKGQSQGSSVKLVGTAPEAPGVPLHATLTWVAE